MSQRDRKALKEHFRNGSLPTESSFEDLIDSSINKIDDGFSKSMEDGLKLAPIADAKKVLSIYYDITKNTPEWSIELEEKEALKQLSFTHPELEKPVLTMLENGNVGVGKHNPQYQLDVNGFAASKGRVGTAAAKTTAKADGQWHTILEDLNYCNAYEVMARVGIHKTGKHALMHAIALSAYGNSASRIKRFGARFSFWRPVKIKLRWKGSTYSNALQIKTTRNLGPGVLIKYHVTQLWNDEEMGLPDHYMNKEDNHG